METLATFQDTDGTYFIARTDVPGCWAAGRTYEQALEDVTDLADDILSGVTPHPRHGT